MAAGLGLRISFVRGWGDDQWLRPVQFHRCHRVTNGARRLAVDPAVFRGFAEMNRNRLHRLWRRGQQKISEGHPTEIHEDHSRSHGFDCDRRLLDQTHRSSVGNKRLGQNNGGEGEGFHGNHG